MVGVGESCVYHDPSTGNDRPAVVAGEVKTGGGRVSASKFDIIVFDVPANVRIDGCNKGEEAGEFEVIQPKPKPKTKAKK